MPIGQEKGDAFLCLFSHSPSTSHCRHAADAISNREVPMSYGFMKTALVAAIVFGGSFIAASADAQCLLVSPDKLSKIVIYGKDDQRLPCSINELALKPGEPPMYDGWCDQGTGVRRPMGFSACGVEMIHRSDGSIKMTIRQTKALMQAAMGAKW